MVGCCLIVLHFRESKNMEAAYGLAVTLTMLMSTVLMSMYLRVKRVNLIARFLITGLFLTIETTFLIANIVKFEEGGYISISLGLLIMAMMLFWYFGETIKQNLTRYESLTANLPVLKALSNDQSIPKFATHLVYLTTSNDSRHIESETMYSILNRVPKRADIYWFIHVIVEDEPYGMRYKVDTLAQEDVYIITFYLGFRIQSRINLLFRMVVDDMVQNKEVTIDSRYKSLSIHQIPGDFRFVLFRRFVSYENELTVRQQITMFGYLLLKNITLSTQAGYGLDTSNVVVEDIPLVIAQSKSLPLKRVMAKSN